MKGEDFCPICGKTNVQFVKGLCKDCFLKKNNPVGIPKEFSFEQCRSCSKIRISGKMLPFDEKLLAQALERKIKTTGLTDASKTVVVNEEDEGFVAEVVVKGMVDKIPMLFEQSVPLKQVVIQCDPCMRLASQYHEAILQLRSKENDPAVTKKLLPKLIKLVEQQRKGNSLAVVTDVSKNRTGFDLKVGSKKAAQIAARQMQKDFGAETKSSSKLLGNDSSGVEKHRFTFLVKV